MYDITVNKFKASEIHIDSEKDNQFYLPVAEGGWTQPDQEVIKQERIAKAEQEQADASTDAPPIDSDYWTITSDVLVRHHLNPRTKMYCPEEADLPIPIRFLDARRRTTTDIEEHHEKAIGKTSNQTVIEN